MHICADYFFAGSAGLQRPDKRPMRKMLQKFTQDENYSEQCRLKCFPNPDHCADQKANPDDRGSQPVARRPEQGSVPRQLRLVLHHHEFRTTAFSSGDDRTTAFSSGDDGTTAGRADRLQDHRLQPRDLQRNRRERLPLEG